MRTFPLTSVALAAALCAPAPLLAAQGPGWSVGVTVTSGDRDLGYRSGLRYRDVDGRHHVRFNFAVVSDYRYGGPDFRVGFERGYREAYARWAAVPAPVVVAPPVVLAPPPPPPVVVDPRVAYGYGRPTFAFDNGYRDGYQEGLNDGRHRHRNDPYAESRWRNADHDYDRAYGSREFYRVNYRHGFEDGYARGYSDGWYYR